jgi:uncharacterized membrane protein
VRLKLEKHTHDLTLIFALMVLTDFFILIPGLSETPVRSALGLPMVLFYPGYALIAALFPKKGDLDGIERLALSFGLSIAVVPLLGLGLNYTPWGIIKPILPVLNLFTFAMLAIAFWRRAKLPEEERFYIPFHEIKKVREEISAEPKSKLDKILTVVLIISILASIAMLIYVIVAPKIGERFTEFYILGPSGKAEGYPTALKLNESGVVIIGIVNHEYELVNYTLEVKLEGDLLLNDKVTLEHNTTYEKPYQITPSKNGTNMKLEFLLFKENNSTPYRNLHLWVNVSST